MAGLFFVWIAACSPFSRLDHYSLTIHMINHLVLMLVAAPLVLAGALAVPLLLGLPPRFGRSVHSLFLHSSAAQRLLHLFRHPVFGWFCAGGAVIGWHVPTVFQLALRSHGWHNVEYASFILAGLLFWRPVMHPEPESRWPRWFIPLYLFLATLPCDILSAFLAFCDRLVYPSYASVTGLFNFSALQDQQCAAAVMWVSVTIAYLLPAAFITIKMLSPHHIHSHLQVEGVPDGPASALSGSQAEVV
jgi:cytochrome c oxidase assembly factor CtaG